MVKKTLMEKKWIVLIAIHLVLFNFVFFLILFELIEILEHILPKYVFDKVIAILDQKRKVNIIFPPLPLPLPPVPSDTLYLNNLSPFSTTETIKYFFRRNGCNPKYVNIIKDENGNNKGFGYAQFSNKEEAKNVLNKLKNEKIDGRTITMEFAKPRNKPSTHLYLSNLFTFILIYFLFNY
jgi:hypothetical protein